VVLGKWIQWKSVSCPRTIHPLCTSGGLPLLHTSITTQKPALICFVVYLDDLCQAQRNSTRIFPNGRKLPQWKLTHPLKFWAEGSGLPITKSAKVTSRGSARVNQQQCQHCGTTIVVGNGHGCLLTYSEEDRCDSGENWGSECAPTHTCTTSDRSWSSILVEVHQSLASESRQVIVRVCFQLVTLKGRKLKKITLPNLAGVSGPKDLWEKWNV
jgi:hypothetical protein